MTTEPTPDIPNPAPGEWPCRCVRRDADGALTHIRLNHITVDCCGDCGACRTDWQCYLANDAATGAR